MVYRDSYFVDSSMVEIDEKAIISFYNGDMDSWM